MSSPLPSPLLPDVSRGRMIHRVSIWLLLAAFPMVPVRDDALLFTFGGLALAYAVALRLLRRTWVDLREEGLARPGAPTVPHRQITSLRFCGYAVASPTSAALSSYLLVGHPGGAFRIASAPGLDRLELYQALLERSRLLAPPEALAPRLAAVRDSEVADFGAAQVLATSRRAVDADDRPTLYPIVGIALGTAIALLAGSLRGRSTPDLLAFAAVGGFLALGWIFYAPLALLRLRLLGRVDTDLGLVVSPRSLTLESPELKGTLLWSEILELRELDHRNWQRRGLQIRVAGSTVRIPDAFRLPLTEIAAVMVRYHRPH